LKNKGIAVIMLAFTIILFSGPPAQNNPIPVDMYLVCECDLQCPCDRDVDFFVKNYSSHTAYLPNSAPWEIWDETQSTLIFAPIALQIIIPLSPSEKFEFSWDKKDNYGTPVPPGNYLCKFHYLEDDMQTSHTLVVQFAIIPCGAPILSAWGIFALVLILSLSGVFLMRRMRLIRAKAR